MSIEKDKHYLEEYARQSLSLVCGMDITTLRTSDKPDIVNLCDSIGIEVVNDVYKNEMELSHFLEEVRDVPVSQIPNEKIDRFYKKGGTFTVKDDQIWSPIIGTTHNTPEHLIETIKRKIEKLNHSGYQDLQEYRLYVFVNSVITQSENNAADADASAKKLLEDGMLQKTVTVNVLGDTSLLTGETVVVNEPKTGLVGVFWIDADVHTWKNKNYYTKLTLNCRNVMATASAGSEVT